MDFRTIRRIVFGAAGLFFFAQAGVMFHKAGTVSDSIFPAAMGALFAVMAITGKSG